MLSEFWIRLRALLRRKIVERELDQELQFHFERQVEQFVQAGLSREQAGRRARLEFGGLKQVKEECRQAKFCPPTSDTLPRKAILTRSRALTHRARLRLLPSDTAHPSR